MTDALHRLLQVQEQDTNLDQIRHRREAHPLRSELAELHRRRVDVEAQLSSAQEVIDRLSRRQADLEAEVEASTRRAEAVEARMYSGQVSASRELQAMSEEVKSLRHRISHLEDEVLAVMEEREPHEAGAEELSAQLAAVDRDAADRLASLRAEEADLDAEESSHLSERSTLAADVPADLLERYEKLRARLGGVAVAELVHGSCGGCHLSLPATELDRVRRAPPDALLTCEQCGRILVRPAPTA